MGSGSSSYEALGEENQKTLEKLKWSKQIGESPPALEFAVESSDAWHRHLKSSKDKKSANRP